jgi:hypothetical protein
VYIPAGEIKRILPSEILRANNEESFPSQAGIVHLLHTARDRELVINTTLSGK